MLRAQEKREQERTERGDRQSNQEKEEAGRGKKKHWERMRHRHKAMDTKEDKERCGVWREWHECVCRRIHTNSWNMPVP